MTDTSKRVAHQKMLRATDQRPSTVLFSLTRLGGKFRDVTEWHTTGSPRSNEKNKKSTSKIRELFSLF